MSPLPPETFKLWVSEDGDVTFVYDDDVADALAPLGQARTVRAGHVEPLDRGGWGVKLETGQTAGPFPTRREGLAAEARLLDANMGVYL